MLERDADRRAVPGGERGVELGEERALPDRETLFIRFDDRPKLDQDDLRVAGGLRANGVGAGDVVAFQLPNWVEAAVAAREGAATR